MGEVEGDVVISLKDLGLRVGLVVVECPLGDHTGCSYSLTWLAILPILSSAGFTSPEAQH